MSIEHLWFSVYCILCVYVISLLFLAILITHISEQHFTITFPIHMLICVYSLSMEPKPLS